MVEAIAALGLVSLVIALLSGATSANLNSALASKVLQKATAVGDEAIECARTIPYERLGHDTLPSGDPAVVGGFFRPATHLLPERIVTVPRRTPTTADAWLWDSAPHHEGCANSMRYNAPRASGETRFRVSRYVTWVDANTQGGAQQDHKRVVVRVVSEGGRRPLSYSASTFISPARRGNAVSKGEASQLGPATVSVSPGATADIPYEVVNHDVAQAFELQLQGAPGGVSVTLVAATSSGTPGTALTDTNGNGTKDTGTVAIGETRRFFASIYVPSGTARGTHELSMVIRAATEDAPRWTLVGYLVIT
ncbi:MAG TPA: hypothetical protein VM840_13365 [Actinomycetota bacterium]|nr:hypothetical protein [Actinomycetota bacterium]